MATTRNELDGTVEALTPEGGLPPAPSADGAAPASASEELAADIQSQEEEGNRVLKFGGCRVEAVARKEGAAGFVVPVPNKPYQRPDPNTFFGATTDKNPSESTRNPDKKSNRHVHWRASEWYAVFKGKMRLHAYVGQLQRTYLAKAGDILYVPPGVPHKVEINPDDGETLVYVFRAPAEAAVYKQELVEWPTKTKP